jgi:hypothetical protein
MDTRDKDGKTISSFVKKWVKKVDNQGQNYY